MKHKMNRDIAIAYLTDIASTLSRAGSLSSMHCIHFTKHSHDYIKLIRAYFNACGCVTIKYSHHYVFGECIYIHVTPRKQGISPVEFYEQYIQELESKTDNSSKLPTMYLSTALIICAVTLLIASIIALNFK